MTISRFYHNPRCSKSRQALSLLHARGITPVIVPYLETPPDAQALQLLLKQLRLPARALLRTGEEAYRALDLDNSVLDEATLIDVMAMHPRLIERPIFIHGHRAVIGRPPERVLDLL